MQRLHQDNDIAAVLRQTRPHHLRLCSVYIRSNSETTRLGIIVPKKHIPLAVHRNKIKRLIRETLSKDTRIVSLKYDILILIKSRISKNISQEIYQELSAITNIITT